jgi:hypothetical protein
MTAKGKRMYEKVKEGGTAYAPSAVVYGAAKRGEKGLVKKKWAKEHGYPKPNPVTPRGVLIYQNDFDEYEVPVHDGVYFTDDRDDATDTAKHVWGEEVPVNIRRGTHRHENPRYSFKEGMRVRRLRIPFGGPESAGPMGGEVLKVTPAHSSGGTRARVRVEWDSGSSASHEDRMLIPEELVIVENPSPRDLNKGVEKYEEFHAYEPKKIGDFKSGFKIPERVEILGEAVHVLYKSDKWGDKGTDYIHKHEGRVKVGEPARRNQLGTKVPQRLQRSKTLVKLGECLGFCFTNGDDEEIEAKATRPYPELYTTPDGRGLFVVQDKRKCLAVIWGGDLGVEAAGIVG